MIKKILSIFLVSSVLFVFATTGSMADRPTFAVGVSQAYGGYEASGTENEGTDDDNPGTHSEDVDMPSVFIEYAAQYEHVGMTFGAEAIPGDTEIGAKSRTDTASDANDQGSADAGTYTAKAEVSDHITIYVEPTLYAGNGFGISLKGGVSHVKVNALESITLGDDSSAYGSQSVFGGMTGAGIKFKQPNGLVMKLEQTSTVYETIRIDGNNGNVVTASPEQDATRISIGYQF